MVVGHCVLAIPTHLITYASGRDGKWAGDASNAAVNTSIFAMTTVINSPAVEITIAYRCFASVTVEFIHPDWTVSFAKTSALKSQC